MNQTFKKYSLSQLFQTLESEKILQGWEVYKCVK
jgi:hypothetical protein